MKRLFFTCAALLFLLASCGKQKNPLTVIGLPKEKAYQVMQVNPEKVMSPMQAIYLLPDTYPLGEFPSKLSLLEDLKSKTIYGYLYRVEGLTDADFDHFCSFYSSLSDQYGVGENASANRSLTQIEQADSFSSLVELVYPNTADLAVSWEDSENNLVRILRLYIHEYEKEDTFFFDLEVRSQPK